MLQHMLVGIDEVGRGCLAGPLVVGAVVLDKEIPGLADSKKLSRSQREKYAQEIAQSAQIGLGWVSNTDLDSIGLSASLHLASRRAMEQIQINEVTKIIIDGNQNFLPQHKNVKTVIKADAIYPCVSAASIVAKVARDEYMIDQAALFPQYGFERHVGYGTKEHMAALEQHGATAIHRSSFAPVKLRIQAGNQ